MATPGGKFAQLGADDVIRFFDAEHFLDELDGNLGRGRAVVRSRRGFEVGQTLPLAIEAPGVDRTLACEARVVVVRDGFVGLELLRFDALRGRLDALAEEAEEALSGVAQERTVIAPMPTLPKAPSAPSVSEPPEPEPEAAPSEDALAAGLTSRAGPRRRRPRPLPVEAPNTPPRRDPARPSPHRRPEPVRAEPEPGPAALESPEPAPERVEPTPVADAETHPATRPLARETSDAEPTSQGLPALSPRPTTETPAIPKVRSKSAVTAPVSGTPPPLLEADDLVLVREGTLVAKLPKAPEAEPAAEPETADLPEDLATDPRRAGPRSATLASAPELNAHETVAVELPLGGVLADPADLPTAAPDPGPDPDPKPELQAAEDLLQSTEEVPELPAPAADLDLALPPDRPDSLLDLELPDPPSDADDEALGEAQDELEVPDLPELPEPDAVADIPPTADTPGPAPKPEPPAPAIPLDNPEALEDKHPALPRVTRGGVLRVPDAATLLGLYLAQVRHGRLTVLGPLEGAPGDDVNIKIVGGTVVSLPATVVSRVGEWLTLDVPDPAPMQEVLQDAADDWQADLPKGAPAAPAAVIAPPAPREPPAVIAPPPPPPAPDAEEPAAASAPPTPAPPPEPEDDGPPEVPRLAGDRVVFRRKKDLEHELGANLNSGGLFVDAPPLPIRTKRQLEVQVGSEPWGVQLQADVVFADGGKVGFSVVNAAEAVQALDALLAKGGPDAADSAPAAAPVGPPPAPSSDDTRSLSADGEAYIGSLRPALKDSELLGLPDKRIDDLSGVMKTTTLQLVEHVVSHRWKGVLKLEGKGREVTAWFHEGSVAFVVSKPYDEANSVGRILINHKKLNEAGLREALETARASKRSLGRALVALGHVKKGDLSNALREQMRMKLDEAFTFDHGAFEWTPWREPPGDADLVLTKGLGVLAHYLRSRFEALNMHELEAMFGKNLDRPVGHDDLLDQSTQGMHLQPKELRFLQLQLDGHRTIQDAVRGSPVGRLASLRLVAVGLALGALHFTVGGRAPRAQTRIGSVPNRQDALSRKLKEDLQLLEGMNHFEVLGVHWSAHHRGYKAAFDKAKKQYETPRRALEGASKDLRTLARKVTERIEEAFKVLNDTTQRVTYRKQFFDATERQYAADMLVKQGEVALMRGDRMGAMEALETAVELDPTKRNRQLLTSAREGRR